MMGGMFQSLPEHWWSVEVKRGDRVERTGADCREPREKKSPEQEHKLMLLWSMHNGSCKVTAEGP